MTDTKTDSTNASRSFVLPALLIILLMGAAYTWLDMVQPPEYVTTILAFIPGLVSLLALRTWQRGMGSSESYLQVRPLSLKGGLALVAATVLMLPILGSSTGFIGWQWLPALVYAPASGIAQELYFRASLLPAFEKWVGKKPLALVLHGLVFIAFHLRTFLAIGPQPVALVVVLVLFAAGCAWGWQVQRDRTVVWAMLQHSLFLVVMSMFAFG
jgi:membrane protease YdiL (CAAX protease family)